MPWPRHEAGNIRIARVPSEDSFEVDRARALQEKSGSLDPFRSLQIQTPSIGTQRSRSAEAVSHLLQFVKQLISIQPMMYLVVYLSVLYIFVR